MKDLSRVINILSIAKLKTKDDNLECEIDKAIDLINQGLEFEKEFEEYQKADTLIKELDKYAIKNTVLNTAQSRFEILNDSDIPF